MNERTKRNEKKRNDDREKGMTRKWKNTNEMVKKLQNVMQQSSESVEVGEMCKHAYVPHCLLGLVIPILHQSNHK